MTESRDWQARIAQAIGRNVRFIREGQSPKMSAQRLSEETERLGHHIQRPVIANLETGRRASVTVTDLLALARALNVPPISLLAPLISNDPVEVLPGDFLPQWMAAGWLEGDYMPDPEPATAAESIGDAYELRFRYRLAELQLTDAIRRASKSSGEARKVALESLTVHLERLDDLRGALERLGVRSVPSATDPRPLLAERDPE